MIIENARYSVDWEGENNGIFATINGVPMVIPLDPNNSDYIEIMKQVADGTITIQDAD